MPFWTCNIPSNTKYSVLILYTRGVKLIFTEGHISIIFALKGPVVIELTTIIYATLMLEERLSDVIMIMLQWNEP